MVYIQRGVLLQGIDGELTTQKRLLQKISGDDFNSGIVKGWIGALKWARNLVKQIPVVKRGEKVRKAERSNTMFAVIGEISHQFIKDDSKVFTSKDNAMDYWEELSAKYQAIDGHHRAISGFEFECPDIEEVTTKFWQDIDRQIYHPTSL